MDDSGNTVGPSPRYEVIKTYPPHGPLQQYRTQKATAFRCCRCGQEKTAKLITLFQGDWRHLLCNGCYGWLLSIYTIKVGTDSIDAKVEALADYLLTRIPATAAKQAAELLALKDQRVALLDSRSLRLLATAQYVAQQLAYTTSLDWSAAMIGLCKAIEVELSVRLLAPLRDACRGVDLRADCADRAIGRVARYCAGQQPVSPELGAIRHLLLTVAQRPGASGLLEALRTLLRPWPNADWLIHSEGAPARLQQLTQQFRNPAAHTSELSSDDYAKGEEFVTGSDGLLWRLLHATTPRR